MHVVPRPSVQTPAARAFAWADLWEFWNCRDALLTWVVGGNELDIRQAALRKSMIALRLAMNVSLARAGDPLFGSNYLL